MKTDKAGLASVVPLIILLGVACREDGARWKGTIEKAGGVTIIKNPNKPMLNDDEAVFALEKELIIGNDEGPSEYVFSQIQGLDVDEDGHIYVLDLRETQVKVFDRQGRFLRAIGRKGQGPGEFQYPVFVQVTPRGELLVYDYPMARAVFHSRSGAFLRQQSSRRPLLPIALNSQGSLVGMEVLAPPPLGGKLLKIYGPDLLSAKVIAQDGQGQKSVFDLGRPTVHCRVAPNDEIIWGHSEDYAINIASPSGETIRIIRREYEPVPITLADKKEFEEEYAEPVRMGMSLRFREHFPAFQGISVDEGGRIFIKTHESAKGRVRFDIFDQEGRYQARLTIQANLDERAVWKKGKLYTIETDELDNPSVVRYQVTWKN